MDKMVGRYMAFRGEDTTGEGDTIIELTDIDHDGNVEIKFDVQTAKLEQIYLKFCPGELVQAVAEWYTGRK